MNTKQQILIALLLVLLAFIAGRLNYSTERITEDDPRWNCHTMGNRICGPSADGKE